MFPPFGYAICSDTRWHIAWFSFPSRLIANGEEGSRRSDSPKKSDKTLSARNKPQRLLLTDKSCSHQRNLGDVLQMLDTEKLGDEHFPSIGRETTKLDMESRFAELVFDKHGRHCRTVNKLLNRLGRWFGEVGPGALITELLDTQLPSQKPTDKG